MDSEDSDKMIMIPAERLLHWGIARLQECGVAEPDARLVTEYLVQTSLWGIDSHGIARLPHYLRRLRAGSIQPRPNIQFHPSGASTGQVDGDHGLGIVVCHRAMCEAIELAARSGVGIVGCYHSTHCGAVGLYGRQATKAGLIGIALTHSDAFVAPHLGKKAFVGTNPICIAVPSADGDPVCVDMATSAIPINRVMNAQRQGHRLPDGAALDLNGDPTTDPNAVAALFPMAEHKGYALSFLIDLLCGPLQGMPYGPHIPAMYGDLSVRRNLGSLMIAIDPNRFSGGALLAETAAAMAREARSQPSVSPDLEVLVPGDPEYLAQKIRDVDGIPVDPELYQELGLTETDPCKST